MAIYITSIHPFLLLRNIKEKFVERGIETWEMDKDGDFTHSPFQWRYHAWFRARVEEERNRLAFYIICRNDKNLSVIDYAVYHGRFAEMLLTHFDRECDSIEITPLASGYDQVSIKKEER